MASMSDSPPRDDIPSAASAAPTGLDDPDLSVLLAEPRHRVSPRAKLMWLANAVVQTVVLLAGAGVWAWFDTEHRAQQLTLGGVLLTLGIASAIVEPWWRYTVHRWDVTPVAVFTRSGWITQERRVAPVSRIQTVDVERGPVAQLFGLATVIVTTASAKGPVKIEGLDLETAERITAELTASTAATTGDAT